MQPKISVIIPVYNVEKFLKRCLESIADQTLSDIEIICVNDGSIDGSLRILEEFSAEDSRVTVLHQENRGVSAARNSALAIARGEYVGFVDGDDWIELNFFEELYAAAKKYNADIACCRIVRKYPSSKSRIKLEIEEEQFYSAVTDKYRITESPRKCYVFNKIYRRSEINLHRLRFREGRTFEDVSFSIRALYFLKTLVTVPTTTYYYWVNHNSITRNETDRRRQDKLAARRDFIKFSRKNYIECDDRWYVRKKIIYKLCGIPVMKIYEWKTMKKYYLFSVIPVFEKKITL
ncbi:MAG: glycosyltransferase [Holosporaceae bacterium]|jgi:glycosyltransferase involved in cell wall biosynthesis|nr:glycosyltransferase [Holosporaceae bacterium]